jgi:hypothetical protein
MRYSPSTGGFYDPEIHGDAIPADAVEVSLERYNQLLEEQAAGRTIVAGNDGAPETVEVPAPSIEDHRAGMQVTAFQAHAVVHRHGLTAAVEAVMAGPATDYEVKLAWDKAQTFSRLSPAVLAIAAQLGLSDIELDAMFAEAALIEA